MLQIEDKLVSEDVLEEAFVCDLTKCKGACCVEGDAGAPLTKAETRLLEGIQDEVKPYLPQAGIDALEQQGAYVIGLDGESETPLANGKECAYTVFENGSALCGIEKAWKAGKVGFRKPISCHLYPVRTNVIGNMEVLNYHKWTICSPACDLGKSLKVRVYQFLKEPLIRKYGEEWYGELSNAADAYFHQFGEKPL
ncbi:MAG: hypothetical protein ACJAY8_001259 [Sphingobacteriales bacterium]|jgi:hypothetical protein